LLSAALAKKPKANRIFRAGQPGRDPAAEESPGGQNPVVAFDSGVDSDIPMTPLHGQPCSAGLAADKMLN